jgi:hypothetical protein
METADISDLRFSDLAPSETQKQLLSPGAKQFKITLAVFRITHGPD